MSEFTERARKIKRHFDSIIATVTHGLSNARLESTNNKIKGLIMKSYGFRNLKNFL
ncbi:transposase [Anaerorhabdus sp.]|uniref:transposase n=1 Tax=Anaerorhabdus sp. TaxID=1872524 RepID=UPI003FA59BDD